VNQQRIYEAMMGEPWCKSVAELRKLTDWQIKNLLFLPALRKAAGSERTDGKKLRQRNPKKMTKKEYFIVGEKLGCTPAMMEKQWADAQAKMGKNDASNS